VGRLLGELVAAGFGFTALFYLGKWINFKYKKMVREDMARFYESHGLEDEIKEDLTK